MVSPRIGRRLPITQAETVTRPSDSSRTRPRSEDWHGSCVSARGVSGAMSVERLVLSALVERCLRGDDGSDCFREGDAYRVRLWGSVPDGWTGHFALHAGALGLEIMAGEAICVGGGRWAATFLIRTSDPRTRMARHDFLHMARRAPRVVPPLPEPEVEIRLDAAPDGASGVVARVTGKDTIGLLAGVMRRFEESSLRPREFSIRTIRDEVDDWFWLEPTSPIDAGARSVRGNQRRGARRPERPRERPPHLRARHSSLRMPRRRADERAPTRSHLRIWSLRTVTQRAHAKKLEDPNVKAVDATQMKERNGNDACGTARTHGRHKVPELDAPA